MKPAASEARNCTASASSAGAAGKLNVFFWDHWVPQGNVVIKEQVDAWAAANKVEVNVDFVTSMGAKNILTITASEEPGTFRGACAEYCGLSHANMKFWVKVESKARSEEHTSELQSH